MTLRVAILDDYQAVALQLADWASLGSDVALSVFNAPFANEAAAAAALAEFDVLCLMRERLALPASLIRSLPALKLVVVTGGRTRTIDLDAAVARGITVCHTHPGQSAAATPELAWGLILALARSIPAEDHNLRAGQWQRTLGETIAGKTLGLLGLGKLGRAMVPIARAFGLDVIAWSPNLTQDRADAVGVQAVSKEDLFGTADVVSLHLVLSDTTRGIVGAREIGMMKPGAMLINTSRGPLVDEPALLAALLAGRIRAGIDVFDIEPLPADSPWRHAPNTVLTPHLGFVTRAAYEAFYRGAVEDIAAWRAGQPVRVLASPS